MRAWGVIEKERDQTLRGWRPALRSRAWRSRSSASLSLLNEVASVTDWGFKPLLSASFFSVISMPNTNPSFTPISLRRREKKKSFCFRLLPLLTASLKSAWAHLCWPNFCLQTWASYIFPGYDVYGLLTFSIGHCSWLLMMVGLRPTIILLKGKIILIFYTNFH